MQVLQINSTKPLVKRTTCTGAGNGGRGCGSRLAVSDTDMFRTYRSCMGRDETWFATFMCPQCGTLTDLADTDHRSTVSFGKIDVSIRSLPFPLTSTIHAAQEKVRRGQGYEVPREQWARKLHPEGPSPWFRVSGQEVAYPERETLQPGVKPPAGDDCI